MVEELAQPISATNELFTSCQLPYQDVAMDPILKNHFTNFINSFDLAGSADEATLFERFVNYVIYSLDYREIFSGNEDLLDSVCVGGPHDTAIDGLGIKVNDSLVSSTDDVEQIAAISRKIDVEFIFIQSKKSAKFDIAELSSFGNGVKNFLADHAFLPENAKLKAIREIKDFIYSDQKIISKLDHHPGLFLYYVTTGIEPTDPSFTGIQRQLKDELSERLFENVEVKTVGAKHLIKFCRELENKFDVQINVLDIFPLTVDKKEDIKKAYAFTCQASEFMKILSKEDGSLRRSLFNNNVRDYLGNKSAINNEIETTIKTDPEMFLLCNNGITIVCTEFDQIRDKLVRIENPQIVNGCQTSNSLFNAGAVPELDRIKLLVKLISTDSHSVTNMIVRGTNKQNQVLDEAFESTLPFHQDVLEPFFISFTNDPRIYYERRARQYSNDPLIKKTLIVNLRILTQTFVSMFLDSPHESHRHEAKLLEEYASDTQSRKIFKEEHGPYPYYVCGLTWYMFEQYFKEQKINPKYKTYKFHLFWIFRMSLGEFPPVLSKTKMLESYCQKLMNLLREPQFWEQVPKVLQVFDKCEAQWSASHSRFAIKDRKEFTDLLRKLARERFMSNQKEPERIIERTWYHGTILRVVPKFGLWFGFISRGSQYDNVYFDSRGYKGEERELIPNRKVRFELQAGDKGPFAKNVEIIQ